MSLAQHSPTRAIALLSFATFAGSAAMRACDPLLPVLAGYFSITTGHAAQVISAFAIAYGLLQAVYGPLGDRYGKFRVIAWATLGCSVGCLGATLATDFAWLVFSRALTGATLAAIMPLSMAWIGDNVAYEERQAVLARYLTGQILGMVSGQLIGGVCADTFGWRSAFGILTGLFIVAGLLLFMELRRNPRVDHHTDGRVATTARAAFFTQTVAVLRIGWVRVVMAAVLLEAIFLLGAFAFVPTYLHLRFGLPLSAAAAIMTAYGLGGIVYAIMAKRLLARMGETGLATAGGLLLGLGFLLLLLGPSWPWALPATLIAGLGFYMLHNTLQMHATQMAPTYRGTAMSIFSASMFLGQSLGVTLAAVVVDQAGALWLFGFAAAGLPVIGMGFAYSLRQRGRAAQASKSAAAI
jgi:predicted MFS family arabinose efflux permease